MANANTPITDQPQSCLSTRDAAKYLAVSMPHLERARYEGSGPPYILVGKRRIVYRRADLDAWMEGRKVRSTAEAAVLAEGS